jgi:polysaccharide biosynthesis protein PslH
MRQTTEKVCHPMPGPHSNLTGPDRPAEEEGITTATHTEDRTALTAPPDRLRIAVLDEELPYPPTTGKRIRTYNLLSQLAARHDISFLCYRSHDPAELEPGLAHFAQLGIRVVMHDEPPPRQSVLLGRSELAWKLFRNLFSPQPFLVENHVRRPFLRMVERIAAEQEIDVWHCEWTPYARVPALLGLRPWVVVAHNVESLIWQRYYETERNPLKRWYIGLQWSKFRRFESRSFRTTSQLVTVSRPDATLAVRHFTARQPAVVDNGVDTRQILPPEAPRDRHSILFLGSLDWRPNLDGVTQLLDEIFPLVQSRQPSAQLHIVGRKPPRWLVERIARQANVHLHADVPSVQPFLHRCSVMAVPLRIGGGSRLKILEALSAELPVVSTTIGAEGLHVVTGEHLTLADSPSEMAAALSRATELPDDLLAQARRGRQLVVEQYDWPVLAEKLDRVWRSVASKGRKATRILELRAAEEAGGGPEKTILEGAAIADARFDVSVCYVARESADASPIADRAASLGIDFIRLRQRALFDLAGWRMLRDYVRDRGIDLVHAHDYKSNFLALALRRALGVKILSTAHGWTGDSRRERLVYYPLDRWFLRRFPEVIAVSSEIADRLRRSGVSSDRITVLPNGVDAERFRFQPALRESIRRQLGIAPDDFVLGSVGRLARQKRFDLLLEAFAQLLPERPQLRLLIAGEGSQRAELQARLQAGHTAMRPGPCRGLAERVTLLGNRSDIIPIYHAFDGFVQSSDYEGTPNVILEAMALEIPLVATSAGGTTDVLRPDVDALVIPCGSVDGLVEGIGRLLDDPEAARKRARAARQRIETELSFARRTRRMETLYQRLLGRAT